MESESALDAAEEDDADEGVLDNRDMSELKLLMVLERNRPSASGQDQV